MPLRLTMGSLALVVLLSLAAAGHLGAGDRRVGFRPGVPAERSTCQGDARPAENRSDEVRIGHGHGLGDPPRHVTRLAAAGHGDRKSTRLNSSH